MEEVRLAVRQLAEFLLRSGDIDSRLGGFDRALEGARLHRRLQKAAGEGYQPEVTLRCRRTAGGIDYLLEGRADGIFPGENGVVTIDEIKTTAVPAARITEELSPCHWAQGMIYAAIYGRGQDLDTLAVRLTYWQIDDETVTRFVRTFSLAALEAFLDDLLCRYAPWARRALSHREARAASLAQLAFPFSDWRAGQRAMAGEVFRACRAARGDAGARLFCQAPTGIGKTMSAVYPALASIGRRCGDKLFYLTARTTACAAAESALALLHAQNGALALRGITLTAKEKVCLCPGPDGRPECLPDRCPYARGYYDRILGALEDALDNQRTFSRAAIAGLAQAHTVCPFELGLDLSEWCDVIVGDYNYLFDPVVRLRRYFDTGGDYLFLIDEAHNLPDRARDMYSAAFSKSALPEAQRALGKGKSRLKTALRQANETLLAYRKACAAPADGEDAAPEGADGAAEGGAVQETLLASAAPDLFGGQAPLLQKGGTRFYRSLPAPLAAALRRVLAPAQYWLEDHRDGPGHETILQLYFTLRDFLRTAEGYDEHYLTQLTVRGAELTVCLLCMDPSAFVDKCLSDGRSAVLFSATLTPPGYYKNVLGCPQARAVALPSPFPPERLGLYCLRSVSTRYRDRAESLSPIAAALAAMVRAKPGNYLAFFPSYAYLRQVLEVFRAQYPDVPVLEQESGLDEAGRAAFLAQFRPDRTQEVLLGFCVMGGVFGEGVDLVGDRLIGCAVVGVGLPQVGPRQEMLRRYYDEAAGCGFDYAYRFPGMNKVLQAAGRVIRTPADKGVVLLIDDRFAQEEYRRLLPPHWSGLRWLDGEAALEASLADFWKS